MPYAGGDGIDITIPAAADLSSYQYRFVKVDANGRGTITTAVTDVLLGILQNKPSAADVPARVRVGGISKIALNQSADESSLLTSNTQGFGLPQGTASNFCGAILLHATGGSGDIQDALVVHQYSV